MRRLWISEARRADSTLASKLRSLRREAAMYALGYGVSDEHWEDSGQAITSLGSLRASALS